MRSLGDINKDGFGDFALSRPDIGVNYIVLGHDGKSRPFTDMVFDKPSADWFKITSYANDTILTTLAGDVNDDGYDDIMLNSGSTVYVLFGKRDQLYDMNASDIKMPNGFKITTANARIMNLNAVGDVNDDKIDDFAITLMTPAPEKSMSIYVIFGSKNSADIDLSNLSPKDGAHITGSPGGVAFNSLLISSVACDYNQDGYSDSSIG